MKLKQILSLLALLLTGMAFSCTLTACGDDKDDDEPKNNKSELIGYWYWEEEGEFEAMSLSEGGSGEYLFGICGNPGSIYSDYITWNENQVQGVKVISVNSGQLIQQEDEDSAVIVYRRISVKEWSNLKRTATLNGSNPGNTDTPDTPDAPDTPKLKKADFYGIWEYNTWGYFELKSNGKATYYYRHGDKLSNTLDPMTGTWDYDEENSILNTNMDGRFQAFHVIEYEYPVFKTKYDLDDSWCNVWTSVEKLPEVE